MTTQKASAWSPAALHRKLEKGERFAILDVRNREEFDLWRIEGKRPIPTVNLPYFDLVALESENEEVAAAVVRGAPEKLKGKLPKSMSILVVCAKGDTSAHVAEGLRRLGQDAVNLEGGMAAWGDHYEMRVVEEGPRLTLLQISRPAKGCLSYMLAGGNEAMVVDAARHIDFYLRIAAERGWRITHVLDTHLQADHISGGVALAKAAGVDYWLHPYDSIHPEDLLPATFTFRYLQGNMRFKLGDASISTLHLPGHTLGMINLVADERHVLTGDTLFIHSIGRPDLGGHAETWAPLLYHSLQRLLKLPDSTVVLSAHFGHMQEADGQGCYRATLGALRKRHEGLRRLDRGLPAFVEHVLANLQPHPPSYDDVRRVNTGLLQVDEAKASELELGHNQCALAQNEESQREAA